MSERNGAKRLMKSRTDRKVDGVLGGIAAYFGWDSTLVRILFIVLLLPSLGTMFMVYIVLDMVMPSAPRADQHQRTSRPVGPDTESKHTSDENWSDF